MQKHENYCKLRLLKLLELLRQETDEQNLMVSNEICRRLMEMNIMCTAHTGNRNQATE